MSSKKKKVNIVTLNDREVIIQIIEIIMQEYPGNSCHIMSDNHHKGICLTDYISASEFIMDIDIYIMFSYMQDSFTKELNIQLKIILEKITQADFDITLIIKNCGEAQHIYITLFIDLVNIIKQKYYSKHLQDTSYIIREKYIKSWQPGVHINFKKSIIKFDIHMGILDILGHFAQRGHHSPSDIEMDISDFEWHFAINIEYHLLDFSSISGPDYLSITSAINVDIIIKADRFIRVIHLFYIYLFNNLDIAIKADQFISVIPLSIIDGTSVASAGSTISLSQ